MTSALLFERNQKSAEAQELLAARMTSSQSAVSYSDQQLSKSYQQMSRQAQEMKQRRRRRFQSQVTVDKAVKRNSEESNVVLKNQQMIRVQQLKFQGKSAGASIWWIACFATDCKTTALIKEKRRRLGLTRKPADGYSGMESAESFNQQLVFGVGDSKTMSFE
ncbi:hypothetical protein F511_43450 [Dorcoceras hygrometricum]|uniref:Uncharacterized protein n=1 Tax=Dorcoceras hygrometricum TaxID=472368 RepID=A0A2Z7C5W2_9LAMI|nr:hypothetical protein F511_43450 [Dorcoceras hygrometricum]